MRAGLGRAVLRAVDVCRAVAQGLGRGALSHRIQEAGSVDPSGNPALDSVLRWRSSLESAKRNRPH